MLARTSEVYLQTIHELYDPLLRAENSVVLLPPIAGKDHLYRDIKQQQNLIQSILGERYAEFEFIYIDKPIDANWMEIISQKFTNTKTDWDELTSLIKTKSQNKELAITINVPEIISNEELSYLLDLCQKIYYLDYLRIHFQLLIDMKWNESDFFNQYYPYRSILQNISQEKYYNDQTIKHFIQFLILTLPNSGDQPEISRQIENFILTESGGIMLIAKAIMRVIIAEKINSLEDLQTALKINQNYQAQLKFIYFRLTEEQRQIVSATSNYQDIKAEYLDELTHLEQIGLILQTNGKYYLKSKALEYFLKKKDQNPNRFNSIILNNNIFSAREQRILFFLIKNINIKVSRQAIAEILWKDKINDKYSDWAIDQAINRIRKKLTLTPELSILNLISVKKIGFQLINND